MKRRIWLAAWLLAMATAFGLYLLTVITEAQRPPEPEWSRPLILDTLEGLSAYELRSNDGIAVAADAAGARIFYQAPQKGLLAVAVDSDGKAADPIVLDAGFGPADRMMAYEEDGALFLAALQERRLNRYRLEGDAPTLSRTEPLMDIRDFDRHAGRWLAQTEDSVFFSHEGGETTLAADCQRARWVPGAAPQACLVVTQAGRKVLQFAALTGSTVSILQEWPLPADAQTAVGALAPYAGENITGALVELKDYKTGRVRVVDYRLTPTPQERELISGDGEMNPVVLGIRQGSLQLLLTQEQRKGDDQSVRNIRRVLWDGARLTPQGFVTRTDALSIPVAGWTAGQWQYVLSTDLSGDAKRLMLSGDAPQLRAQTAPLSREELEALLPGAVMTLLPATMVGLFPAVYILMPVLSVLFAVSAFNLSWAERNSRLLLRLALGGHLLAKVLFAYTRVLFNGSIPDMATQLPWYLNSPGTMALTLLVSTAAAWAIARLRNPSRAPGDFWGPYVQFALLDLSLFILLVMPYYYAYVGLPVFFR